MKTYLLAALLLVISASVPGITSSIKSTPELTDADEVRIGAALAKDFEQQEGIAPTPQSIKLDAYLQSVGDKVAVGAKRKLPYRFHFDPSPGFRSAVGLPGGQIMLGLGSWRTATRRISWQWCLGMKSSTWI
jgi:hypothetical protein